MTHGHLCPCFDCLTSGPTRCSRDCALRFGHPGPHMGMLSVLRLWVKELRRTIAAKIAGHP